MKRSIEIIIKPGGELKIEAIGFKGPDCEAATKHLEEALGLVKERQRKPEFNSTRTAARKQPLGGT
jgi:hypothetical protein